MNINGHEFKREEFFQMEYNAYEPELLKRFPHLKRYAAFNESFENYGKDSDKVLRYIFLLYSKDSPVHKIVEIDGKKEAAAVLVFGKKGYEDILTFDCEAFRDALTAFFRVQHNTRFELYMTLLEGFSMLLAAIREPISSELDDDKRMKAYSIKEDLKAKAIKAEKELSEVARYIFSGDAKAEKTVVEKTRVNANKQKRNTLEAYVLKDGISEDR